ncbi:hypothetical protein [Desulfocurvibacter africanus]|nr:hypothetical protein [Desulfocurvibacter africanus]
MYRLASVVLVAAVLLGTGCETLGSRALRGERGNYNIALQQSNDEQLLLNLVRLRYRDNPVFLDVGNITTQFSLETTLDAGIEAEESAGDIFSLGGGVTYNTSPTIQYTPLSGEDFQQRLMTPLGLDRMLLLYQAGWSLKRVFTVLVQRLNNLENAVRASGPTPGSAPEYETFQQALEAMRGLERLGLLELVQENLLDGEPRSRVVLSLKEGAWDQPQAELLARLLGLSRRKLLYPIIPRGLVQGVDVPQGDYIMVETRSPLGAMFFLSHAVDTPEDDQRTGKVTTTRTNAGQAFDWHDVTSEVFEVKTSAIRPTQASTAVRYRGAWFYIADTNLETKSSFAMLNQLLILQSKPAEAPPPVLTLPVGR